MAARTLRFSGILLVVLGVVHLAATSHIQALLEGMRSLGNYQLVLGATTLNHVLVGLLLIPLGYSTWLAAADSHVKESWARKMLRVNAAATLTLPAAVAAFMRQPESYSAPLFLTGVILAVLLGVTVLVATVFATRQGTR